VNNLRQETVTDLKARYRVLPEGTLPVTDLKSRYHDLPEGTVT